MIRDDISGDRSKMMDSGELHGQNVLKLHVSSSDGAPLGDFNDRHGNGAGDCYRCLDCYLKAWSTGLQERELGLVLATG
jgi:hypothetical protein